MSKIWILVGLGYGDEGKGSVTDFIVRQEKASLVVRFNGGAQAGHSVIDEDGRHHIFSQFGAGTFAGARTFLSRYMLVNPCTLTVEAEHLAGLGIHDPLSLVTIENRAVVTTPLHMAANRIREMARTKRHGSCGMGIGETVSHALTFPADAYYVRDMLDLKVSRAKLKSICNYLKTSLWPLVEEHLDNEDVDREWDILADFETTLSMIHERQAEVLSKCQVVDSAWLPNQLHREDQTVIFEGAQGVLLDQDYGWAPHTTWTDCTFGNATKLLSSVIDTRCSGTQGHITSCRCNSHPHKVTRVGVLRGYMTRHGAGPLVTECPTCKPPPGEHNVEGPWQQGFRMGHFDAVATRYALKAVGGVDYLALTCLDHLQTGIQSSTSYLSRKTLATYLEIPFHPVDPQDDVLHSKQQQRQKAVGESLPFMQPNYGILPNVDSFIAHVEKETKTPVRICSYGPKASDKRTR